MPRYNFKDKQTNQVFTLSLSIAQREQYLKNNPDIEQVLSCPSVVDPVRIGVKTIDNGFNDVLHKAKDAHCGSTINTK